MGYGLRTAVSHEGVALQSQHVAPSFPCMLAPRTRTHSYLLAN